MILRPLLRPLPLPVSPPSSFCGAVQNQSLRPHSGVTQVLATARRNQYSVALPSRMVVTARAYHGGSSFTHVNRGGTTLRTAATLAPVLLRDKQTEAISRRVHRRHLASTISSSSSTSSASTSSASGSTTAVVTEDELDRLIQEASILPQTSVSLQALMRTGQGEFLHRTFGEETRSRHMATDLVLIQVAGFLRRELPIRLAHRIRDLQTVPLFSDMPSIVAVRDLYRQSFHDLVELPGKITTVAQEDEMARALERVYDRHANVIVQMARGAFEFRKAVRERGDVEFETQQEIHDFLDRFYICRIGIRVLIGQYLALRQPPVQDYVGIICSRTSPYEIVKRAIDDAAFMCTRKYGDAPEVIMSGRLDLTFPYVPTHLHYILLELLKNSMRATVEWHGIDADYPPIKVVIADGDENEDVVIKVSDEGGGIPRSNVKKIWSYLFTTADPSIQEGMVGTSPQSVDHGIDAPLAGLGYGLPISRSYCRYFGGDLSIMSMEGYGTDAFVYLARLGDSREPLPI